MADSKKDKKKSETPEDQAKSSISVPCVAGKREEEATKRTISKWRHRFLEVLSETGNVSAACRAVSITRTTFYRYTRSSARFAAQVDEARRQAVSVLEDEAWRRAVDGDSDRVLIFLLGSLKPEVYGNRGQVTVSGPDGGPMRHAIGPDRDTMVAYSQDPEALSAMAILASKSAALQLAAEDDEDDE